MTRAAELERLKRAGQRHGARHLGRYNAKPPCGVAEQPARMVPSYRVTERPGEVTCEACKLYVWDEQLREWRLL